MSPQSSFPQNLKQARKARGLTLDQLADALDSSKGYLSDLEGGRRPMPPGPMLGRLAGALGVSLGDLVRDPDDKDGGVGAGSSMISRKNGAGHNLRAWREFRRMTQEELAQRVGTTPALISHLETEKRGLSAKWLYRLAPVLNTTPGLLLDRDPTDPNSEILEIWARIPEDRRDHALQVLATFVRNFA